MAPMALLQNGCRPRKHHKGFVQIAACTGTWVQSGIVPFLKGFQVAMTITGLEVALYLVIRAPRWTKNLQESISPGCCWCGSCAAWPRFEASRSTKDSSTFVPPNKLAFISTDCLPDGPG